MFDRFQEETDKESVNLFNAITIVNDTVDLSRVDIKIPTATWTYLINDNPFANTLELMMAGNIGLSAAISFMWPLFALYALVKALKKRKKK